MLFNCILRLILSSIIINFYFVSPRPATERIIDPIDSTTLNSTNIIPAVEKFKEIVPASHVFVDTSLVQGVDDLHLDIDDDTIDLQVAEVHLFRPLFRYRYAQAGKPQN